MGHSKHDVKCQNVLIALKCVLIAQKCVLNALKCVLNALKYTPDALQSVWCIPLQERSDQTFMWHTQLISCHSACDSDRFHGFCPNIVNSSRIVLPMPPQYTIRLESFDALRAPSRLVDTWTF